MPYVSTPRIFCSLILCAMAAVVVPTIAADTHVLVKDGAARVKTVYIPADEPEESAVRLAAADFVEAVQAMSGAELTVAEWPADKALPTGPLMALGSLANAAGAAPAQTSLWRDSTRVVIDADRVLVGGESDTAVNDGVLALLHELGVRYLLPRTIPGDPGTVFPQQKSIAFAQRDTETRPFVRSRRLWGHNVGVKEGGRGGSIGWIRRNGGVSAVVLETSHAWSHLLPKDAAKPEHFAIKRYGPDGEPVRSKQFCVSNPEVAQVASEEIIRRFKEDPTKLSQSLSPTDGGGSCICLSCQQLDTPGYIEPSSGKPVLTDRYLHFHNEVARRIAAEQPDRFLPFFVYSEYSRPPRQQTELHDSLVPVFAPIRYPRAHGMHNPISEQNVRLRKEIIEYAAMAKQVGYYGYNYNLAETTVPFSKVSTYSQDLPWLASLNLVYISMETLGNWNTQAPHLYLSARYPLTGEDPAAIMDDYYTSLAGAAAPHVRAYWEDVDATFRESEVQSGSYFGLERTVTPERLAIWDGHLQAAAKAAQTDRERAVVALFQSGVEQARMLTTFIRQLNALEIADAVKTRDAFLAFNDKLETDKVISMYPNRYFGWFLNNPIEDARLIVESGGQIVQKLPNTWGFRLDLHDVGRDEEWYALTNPSSRWRPVTTYGGPTLYEQGYGDFMGFQWFRTTITAPEDITNLMLWFGGNDGATRVWVNGKPVPIPVYTTDKKTKETTLSWEAEQRRGWRAFSVPVSDFLQAGKPATIVIRVDHSGLNELNLGGMLRPVMLYRAGEAPPVPAADTYQRIDL